jgi:hypothetical protein
MPIAIPAAIIGAGALTAGASIISGNKAAKAANNAAQQNNQLQTQIYNQNKTTLTPFINSGTQAQGNINALLGLGGDATAANNAFNTFQNSDGYQFRVGEGMRALNTGLASRGLIQSGAAIKEAEKLGQNYGSDEFGRYLGYLGNQQGVGLSAANALAGVGTNYGNAVSNNNNYAASATGNAALNTGANIGNFASNAVNAFALRQGLNSSYSVPSAMSALPSYNINPGYTPQGVQPIGSYGA